AEAGEDAVGAARGEGGGLRVRLEKGDVAYAALAERLARGAEQGKRDGDAGDGALGPHPRRDREARIARAAADIENAFAGNEPRAVHRPAAEGRELVLDASGG